MLRDRAATWICAAQAGAGTRQTGMLNLQSPTCCATDCCGVQRVRFVAGDYPGHVAPLIRRWLATAPYGRCGRRGSCDIARFPPAV